MHNRWWWALGLPAVMLTAACSEPEFVGNPPNVACALPGSTRGEMEADFDASEQAVGDVTRSYLSHADPPGVAWDWAEGSSDADRRAFEEAMLRGTVFVSLAGDFDDC